MSHKVAPRDKRPWWRDAVTYQIYIRSFADGNGDGIGDIKGIRSRVPYIKSLGVDSIWITPWYPSPQKDHGYDVANYMDIEPAYGTLKEAELLIKEIHEAGMKILIDIVPNHSSDKHEWFQAALKAPPGSPERDRYIFRDGKGPNGEQPPNNWPSVFGGTAWQRIREADGSPGQWYLHLFAVEQPDFNWENADVRAHFEQILRFWLDRDVDGFRIDVAHGMVKAPGLPDLVHRAKPKRKSYTKAKRSSADLRTSPGPGLLSPGAATLTPSPLPEVSPGPSPIPETKLHMEPGDDQFDPSLVAAMTNSCPYWDQDGVHDIFRAWRKILDSYPGDRMAVAEAWVSPPSRIALYLRPDELANSFNFQFLDSAWDANSMRHSIDTSLEALVAVGAPSSWVFNNHDVARSIDRFDLDLEACTAETTADHFGDATKFNLSRGTARARAGAMLMLALPGGAYMYQGEELGLPEVRDLPEHRLTDPRWTMSGNTHRGRDGCRVPLPWTESPAGAHGFSSNDALRTDEAWLPQSAWWGRHAADMQEKNEDSTLNMYRRALELRHAEPGLGDGPMDWLDSYEDVLAFKRPGNFACYLNFGDPIPLPKNAKVLLASGVLENNDTVLPTDTCVWLRMEA